MSNKTDTFGLCAWSVIVVLALVSPATIVGQTCPPCNSNQNHFSARNGFGESGRQVATILIDSGNMTAAQRTTVNTAVNGAMNQWNNAINPSVAPDQWNHRIQYEFQGALNLRQADFIVRMGSPLFNCIGIDLSVYPHVITVGSNWFNNTSPEEREGAIAHEIAHRIGLAHPADDPNANCEFVATIMRGANMSCSGAALKSQGMT